MTETPMDVTPEPTPEPSQQLPLLAVPRDQPRRLHVAQVGTRKVSLTGWSSWLAQEHVQDHLAATDPRLRWCVMECLGRTMRGRASAANTRWARTHVAGLYKFLDVRGLFLLVEFNRGRGSRGEILAMKIYQRDHPDERQYALTQLARIERRFNLNAQQLARARALIEGLPPATADGVP
jgi:hypothetical protein